MHLISLFLVFLSASSDCLAAIPEDHTIKVWRGLPLMIGEAIVGEIEVGDQIGEGSTGKVYQGVLKLHENKENSPSEEIVAVKVFEGHFAEQNFNNEKKIWEDLDLLIHSDDQKTIIRPFYKGITLLDWICTQSDVSEVERVLEEQKKIGYFVPPDNIIVDPKPGQLITRESMQLIGRSRSSTPLKFDGVVQGINDDSMKWYRAQLALFHPSVLTSFAIDYLDKFEYGEQLYYAQRAINVLGTLHRIPKNYVEFYDEMLMNHDFGGRGRCQEYQNELNTALAARSLLISPQGTETLNIKDTYLKMLEKRGFTTAFFEEACQISKDAHDALVLPFQSGAEAKVKNYVNLLKSIGHDTKNFKQKWALAKNAVRNLKFRPTRRRRKQMEKYRTFLASMKFEGAEESFTRDLEIWQSFWAEDGKDLESDPTLKGIVEKYNLFSAESESATSLRSRLSIFKKLLPRH